MVKFIKPDWPAPKEIKALTTTKKTSHTHPEHDANLTTLLSLPTQPCWLEQMHSDIVIKASSMKKQADAAYTNEVNQICAVLTADCLPVLLCNQSYQKESTYIAAIHAGWRGLLHGIIQKTYQCLNTPGDRLLAWLGPAISQKKFEVGDEVYEAFIGAHPAAKAAFFKAENQKWYGDLYMLARQQLSACGIEAIYGGDYCTYTQDDLFYSYRRDQGEIRRLATMIWISP